MEEVKQILVVDDYFQMLEFLRSVLEFSHHEYQVLAVPSAEEGVLELRRTAFDLVITDVRLPGMSGFDMVRQIKRLNPDIPVIMITAYSTEQGRKEAEELGVKRYFKKPLDPDELLATVHSILYGTDQPPVVEEEAAPKEATALPIEVRRRLETLRADTGARYVILSNLEGKVLVDGGGSQALNLPALATGIAKSMESSFQLAGQLNSQEPFTIQYQSGRTFDLYFANVGKDFIVSIFFDAKARRGRLGTVWVFAQRAISDLRELLAGQESNHLTGKVQQDGTVEIETLKNEEQTADTNPEEKHLEVKDSLTPVEELEETTKPEEADLDPETTQEITTPALDDIRAYLGIDNSEEGEEVDLDSFWHNALEATEQGNDLSSGMSLEEARKQGLIPTEFDQPDQLNEAE